MSQPFDETLVQTDQQREKSRELSLRTDRPPLTLEGYEFLQRLGVGAYGSVWLAREENTGKRVAIKFYTHRRGLDWSLLNREVEKLAVLYTSRNIVGLLDVGWNSDPPYYVMEYLENGSLDNWLADGPLPADEAVRVANGIAKGLVHAHGSGILHCDLKPANVLFDAGREPRLCDFGQSRLSHEQNPALGTLFYMAPEQADIRSVPDARWDVYALGALLYQMLTGAPPYRTPDAEARLRAASSLQTRLEEYQRVLQESPTPDAHRSVPGVDARLIEIIDRCLSIDPAQRYPNAQAVLERLAQRERQRARGPLLRLGIIGPVLLLAAMAPLFVHVMRTNLQTLEEQLTRRALENAALTARVQAQSLEDEFHHRITELEHVLGNPDLVAALEQLQDRPVTEVVNESRAAFDQQPSDRPEWIRLLDNAHERAGIRAHERSQDTSWFLTNPDGVQLWRRGKGTGQRENSLRTLGRNYSFRDYFNGKGEDLSRDLADESVAPFPGNSRVSIAFRSEATGRYMVAVTVKALDASGRLLGILGRTTHLDEFRDQLAKRIGADRRSDQDAPVDREIALADTRNWQLLDHTWLSHPDAGSVFKNPAELFQALKLSREMVKALGNGTEVTRTDYRDPVGGVAVASAEQYRGPWLTAAAMVPVGATVASGDARWLVIIQERRSAALGPVEKMSQVAMGYGLVAILICLGVIMVVWLAVLRTMRVNGTPSRHGAL